MKYRIEKVYRVWDMINGGEVTIQEGDDEGVFEIGSTVITVEQIPGIIEVLSKLKKEYDAKVVDGPVCDTCENARSGRPVPPF